MTDKNKTEIIVIVDRSGSMSSIAKDMEGGFAQFMKEQKEAPGQCSVSLYRFDSMPEDYAPHAARADGLEPGYVVDYEGISISSVPPLNLVPRGMTALFDAVGKTIVRVGERLKNTPEDQRPGAVVVLIITDGQENASVEYNSVQVKAMIERQEKVYNWRFAYLGAAGLEDAQAIGIQAMAMQSFTADTAGVGQMYSAVSSATRAYRGQVAVGNVSASLNVADSQTTDSTDPTDAA